MFFNIRAFLFFQSERGHFCPQYRSSDEKASFYTILNSFRAFFALPRSMRTGMSALRLKNTDFFNFPNV